MGTQCDCLYACCNCCFVEKAPLQLTGQFTEAPASILPVQEPRFTGSACAAGKLNADTLLSAFLYGCMLIARLTAFCKSSIGEATADAISPRLSSDFPRYSFDDKNCLLTQNFGHIYRQQSLLCIVTVPQARNQTNWPSSSPPSPSNAVSWAVAGCSSVGVALPLPVGVTPLPSSPPWAPTDTAGGDSAR